MNKYTVTIKRLVEERKYMDLSATSEKEAEAFITQLSNNGMLKWEESYKKPLPTLTIEVENYEEI